MKVTIAITDLFMSQKPVDRRPFYCQLIDRLSPKVTDCWADEEKFAPENVSGPDGVKLLFAATYAERDICNGGFHQFFGNDTGRLAPEAIEGFCLIGIEDAGVVIAKAMKFFGASYPRNREERSKALEAVPGFPNAERDEWDPFTALDEAFYACLKKEPDRFDNAANAFAQQFDQ